jgi:hypothetical protein
VFHRKSFVGAKSRGGWGGVVVPGVFFTSKDGIGHFLIFYNNAICSDPTGEYLTLTYNFLKFLNKKNRSGSKLNKSPSKILGIHDGFLLIYRYSSTCKQFDTKN